MGDCRFGVLDHFELPKLPKSSTDLVQVIVVKLVDKLQTSW